MYTPPVKRIQLYVDDETDHALSAVAAKSARSRSQVMREAVRAYLGMDASASGDPLDDLVGQVDIDPEDDIDSVVYGV